MTTIRGNANPRSMCKRDNYHSRPAGPHGGSWVTWVQAALVQAACRVEEVLLQLLLGQQVFPCIGGPQWECRLRVYQQICFLRLSGFLARQMDEAGLVHAEPHRT